MPTLGRRHGRRCGRERFLHDAQDLLALTFGYRLQAAELQSRELDAACAANGVEAEVGEEVRREDRLVDLETLVLRLALGITVRERLQCLRLLVARIADRGEEQRLHDPRRRHIDE